jgi:dTDP-4-dehydrorhamnose 3,5-epimerase
MKVERLSIPDVCVIQPRLFADSRGHFLTTWQDAAFRADVCDVGFVQDNTSVSHQDVIRGMHFQLRHTQGKLVRCVRGRVWDVVVDVRRSAPTFGHWVGAELSDENHHQLWIPAGFAHGFLVLSATAEIQYKVTDQYDPASERTLLWNDPAVGIRWPLVAGRAPILSEKDAAGVPLHALEVLA